MSRESNASNLKLSLILSTALFLVTLTFKSYFYFVPFQAGVNLFSILQALTIIGWISLIAAPPLFFASDYRWTRNKFYLFMVSVLLWTGTTLIIKINTLISFGQIWTGYLTTYPVMIFFEWIAPLIYAVIAYKEYKPELRKAPRRERSRDRDYDDDYRDRDDRRDKRRDDRIDERKSTRTLYED